MCKPVRLQFVENTRLIADVLSGCPVRPTNTVPASLVPPLLDRSIWTYLSTDRSRRTGNKIVRHFGPLPRILIATVSFSIELGFRGAHSMAMNTTLRTACR